MKRLFNKFFPSSTTQHISSPNNESFAMVFKINPKLDFEWTCSFSQKDWKKIFENDNEEAIQKLFHLMSSSQLRVI